MPLPPSSLVGSVVERSSHSSSSLKPVSSPSPSGFPSVQHRSKSAFARAREAKRNGIRESQSKRTREVPIIRSSGDLLLSNRGGEDEVTLANGVLPGPSKISTSNVASEEWKAQMRRENDCAIEAMSEEERERHAAEILEQLGPNVGELLQKAREARTRVDTGHDTEEKQDEENRRRQDEHESAKGSGSITNFAQPTPISPIPKNKFASPPRSILSLPSSRSSSPGRSARKLRFADVTAKDVHVFQSEPSSPRRPLGLLLPPPSDDNGNTKDTEMSSEQQLQPEPEPEEGTPEYIRRRFFPDARIKDPALQWMESSSDNTVASDSEPRIDLSGAVIPATVRESLPTHLGLHHHGGSSDAGYTLSDLFLLARSSVPAQRATVLGVLSKLVRRLARHEREVSEIKDRDSVRGKALVIGLAAISEKGTVSVQATDLVWTCVIYWDEDEVGGLNGIELRPANPIINPADEGTRSKDSLPPVDPISSLPFSALLPQIAVLLDSQSLSSESQLQLLSILQRFARHSVEIATAICETPRLVASVVNSFLLTLIPPRKHGPLPNPAALELLRVLAISSRANARALEGPTDALLRFITTAAPLSVSAFPHPLSDALLRGTLDLYATLGRYGLYCGVATTAAEHFNRLSSSILQPSEEASSDLKVSWLRLMSVWMVCARDPHRTSPAHDLLWSQVSGWAWKDDILEFRKTLLSLTSVFDDNRRLWGAVWDALASWLEGCRVNCSKSGQDERDSVNAVVEETWTGGIEKDVLTETVAQLNQELSRDFSEQASLSQRTARLSHIADLCRTLADFTRFCLACLPKYSLESSAAGWPSWVPSAVELLLPVASKLLLSDILRSITTTGNRHGDGMFFKAQIFYLREASRFLGSFVKLLRSTGENSNWPQWSLATLQTILPGDEESATWLTEEIVEKECAGIECSSKLQFLTPFFKNIIRPDDAFYLSPLSPTPDSIQSSTTQCLPANGISGSSACPGISGLPFRPDWPCVALDHLLRSGTSPILTNPDSVPDSWNASETDLTQASLSLMLHVQTSLSETDWLSFAPSFEHVVFNCMKVFMLEHNQQQGDSNEEVFRDPTVGRLMDALLAPYTNSRSQILARLSDSPNLEVVSKGFLGEGTPFFQFYTDFVALYDAISFSHSTFARLLLPPTSTAYALDYRKLLWGDFGHTLRTVRTPIEYVPSMDLKEFFWPVEADAEMLGWYLRALVKWPLDGFVRFVAVHHLASNIWPDIRQGQETSPAREKHAQMLLGTIFNQAKSDVVKDVVRYVQGGPDDLQLPPICYDCRQETRAARLNFVRSFGETRIAESIEKIFGEEN